jgi:hypothetical protein
MQRVRPSRRETTIDRSATCRYFRTRRWRREVRLSPSGNARISTIEAAIKMPVLPLTVPVAQRPNRTVRIDELSSVPIAPPANASSSRALPPDDIARRVNVVQPDFVPRAAQA